MLAWLPSYFHEVHGLSITNAGLFSAGPWLTMFVFIILGAWTADSLVQRGIDLTLVRKVMQVVGLLGSTSFFWCVQYAGTATTALSLMCGVMGSLALTWSGFRTESHGHCTTLRRCRHGHHEHRRFAPRRDRYPPDWMVGPDHRNLRRGVHAGRRDPGRGCHGVVDLLDRSTRGGLSDANLNVAQLLTGIRSSGIDASTVMGEVAWTLPHKGSEGRFGAACRPRRVARMWLGMLPGAADSIAAHAACDERLSAGRMESCWLSAISKSQVRVWLFRDIGLWRMSLPAPAP
jgi:hypothetical protein